MAVARRHLTMHVARCAGWLLLLVLAVVGAMSVALTPDAALVNLTSGSIDTLIATALVAGTAAMVFFVAALEAPLASFQMRAVSFTAVPPKVRPWVVAENVLNVVVTLALIGIIATGVWSVAVVLATWWALQLTMNAWASHVPHRAPVWLMAVASRLVWTGSPVVLSLVYHLEHHAHPRVPCATLRPDLELDSPLLAQQQQRALSWAPLQPQRPRPSHVLRGMG